jgi:hypothetical protein
MTAMIASTSLYFQQICANLSEDFFSMQNTWTFENLQLSMYPESYRDGGQLYSLQNFTV